MRVKGGLFVHKKTLKITGTYETKKPNSEGWFEPGTLSGKMLVRVCLCAASRTMLLVSCPPVFFCFFFVVVVVVVVGASSAIVST